jgi:hypothetical protein
MLAGMTTSERVRENHGAGWRPGKGSGWTSPRRDRRTRSRPSPWQWPDPASAGAGPRDPDLCRRWRRARRGCLSRARPRPPALPERPRSTRPPARGPATPGLHGAPPAPASRAPELRSPAQCWTPRARSRGSASRPCWAASHRVIISFAVCPLSRAGIAHGRRPRGRVGLEGAARGPARW